ncbi:MAG: hypothetical protein HQL90_04205 [Magnetococcales bacterium]|nr:hypothetical protein [Magnetococcales bacterium]
MAIDYTCMAEWDEQAEMAKYASERAASAEPVRGFAATTPEDLARIGAQKRAPSARRLDELFPGHGAEIRKILKGDLSGWNFHTLTDPGEMIVAALAACTGKDAEFLGRDPKSKYSADGVTYLGNLGEVTLIKSGSDPWRIGIPRPIGSWIISQPAITWKAWK